MAVGSSDVQSFWLQFASRSALKHEQMPDMLIACKDRASRGVAAV